MQLPSVLHVPLNSYENKDKIGTEHNVKNYDHQTRSTVKLGLSEDFSVDA